MLHSRRDGDRQDGQIIVLFELCMIVILVCAAIVIDLGFLRNNRQILVNTLDAAALAGGSVLPVDGSAEALTANGLIDENIQANFPGLPTTGYTITYKCLIGADGAGPLISRDVPAACDPRPSLGLGATLPPPSAFTGAGPTRVSACNPMLGDKCNVVLITGSQITPYSIGPVVGVNSGSTGMVVAAACNGPCGASPVVPVDLVIILDRTGSMSGNDSSGHNKITSLQTAAKAVLGVYDPAKQRVALALTGPGTVDASGSPTLNACPAGGTAYGVADDGNFFPHTTLSGATTTMATASTTVHDPTTALGGPLTSLSLKLAKNGTTITVPAGGKAGFPAGTGWVILVDNEQMTVTANPASPGNTWTVTKAAGAHSVNAPVSTPNYINATATTINVTSAAEFPTSGSYSIQIDSEQMLVTGGQGTTTWTVARGQGGTTAAAHSSGETAILVITAASSAIPVTAKTNFPTTYPFTIKVDSEQMNVTASPSATLWTVTRAQGGTAAAAHSNGAAVSWNIDKDDTTIFVASQAGFPAFPTSPFTIKIDSELMLVTAAPSGTSWTVTRGQGGTTAAAHAGGAAVAMTVGKTDSWIRVVSALGIPTSGSFRMLIDSEQVQATVWGTPTSTTILNVSRAQNGTTAATHNAGAPVKNLTSWIPDPATAGVWVPVGLSGTDTVAPLPDPSGAAGTYEVAGTANASSDIVKAINCIQDWSSGTTLAMPLAYAKWYLDTYGRPGVTKGILLETDGHPEDGGGGNNLDALQFTCGAAITAANAAKAEGIKIYSVGYGINSGNCQSTGTNSSETKSGMTSKTLLQTVATGPAAPYYFDSPAGSDLAGYFRQIAADLAHSGAHLIQLYPAPIVTSAIGATSSVGISGQYFTGTYSVTFGGTSAVSASVTNDTSITAHAPDKPSGTVVDVVVTTTGGSSAITSVDKYTYP